MAELRAAGGYPAAPAVKAAEPKRRRVGARFAAWSLALGLIGACLTGFGVAVSLGDDSLYPLLLLLPLLFASAWYVLRHGSGRWRTCRSRT